MKSSLKISGKRTKEICSIGVEQLAFQSNIQQQLVLGKVILSYTVLYPSLYYVSIR